MQVQSELNIGDTLQVKVEGIGSRGEGLARHNGTEIFNIQHPNLDTLTRWGVDEPTKRSDNQHLYWLIGNYPLKNKPHNGPQIVYTDDAYITNYLVGPGTLSGRNGDLDGDSDVDFQDWLTMLIDWFTGGTSSDLNGDGTVNALDFGILNSNWTG